MEKEELVSSESDVAQRFSQFSSNIVKNLDIPKYVVGDTLHLNLKNHPILMAISGIIQALLLLSVSVIKLYLSIFRTWIKRQLLKKDSFENNKKLKQKQNLS